VIPSGLFGAEGELTQDGKRAAIRRLEADQPDWLPSDWRSHLGHAKMVEAFVHYDDNRSYIKAAAKVCQKVKDMARGKPIRIELRPEIVYNNCHGIVLTDLFAEKPGSGVGTPLMKYLLQLADEAGLNVYTDAEGPRSHDFYTKLGFSEDRTGRHQLVFYPDPGEEYAYLYESEVAPTLYHVTFTSRLAKISQEGIVPGKKRNWDRAFGGKYGERGNVYVFTSAEAAARWAHKMQYEFSKPCSIIELTNVPGDLIDDPSGEQHLMVNGSGTWKMITGAIPASCIHRVIDLDPAIVRRLVDVTAGRADSFDLFESESSYASTLDEDGLIAFAWECVHEDEIDEVNDEFIDEMFEGASAVLKRVPIAGLKLNGGVEVGYKSKQYRKLTTEAPPIIVNGSTKEVMDGNHRLREALRRGQSDILAYVVSWNEEPL
jgi:GNAT superfamily N-acetyltransferase